jgi:8-oxo-dGTP pyrophosphatase MutT (NUDIX family)
MNQDTKNSAIAVIPWGSDVDSYFCYVAPRGKAFAGRYRFAGGRLKIGELYSETLIRELTEEYGITLSDIRLHESKPNVLGGVIYLCSAQRSGEPIPKETGVGAPEWRGARELMSSDLVPNCKLALCAYLLESNPKQLETFFPLMTSDDELVQIAKQESPDLWKRVMRR